jgi:hypothetical protein
MGLLLLFNWAGYRAVFSWLESHSSELLNVHLDNRNYQEDELVTIKLPIDDLPYYTNSPIFERVKGDVVIGGMKYQYVERRIYNDSLEMRCIPNAQATNLTNARDAFFTMVNDLQHVNSTGKQQPAKQTLTFKNLLADYLVEENAMPQPPVQPETTCNYNLYSDHLAEACCSPAEQPPDAALVS